MARKVPKKITKSYLENAALHYLQRYATSSANFRKVMMRKVERSCCHHGGEAAEFAPLVEDLVRRYTGVGLLNDEVFAKARVSTLRRQGRSRRAIEARLQGKGLPRGEIEAAMAGEEEGAEFDAALHLARKKKLGPFRVKEADPKKEMAAMARAGFSFEVAKRVLDYKGEGEE